MTKLIAAVIGVLGIGALVACGSDDQGASPPARRGELTIYSSLPLQGDSRPQSEDIVRAFRLALADHDHQAGGHDIRYVSLDDADPEVGAWTPDLAAANAWAAAGDPSTVAYLGEFNSGATAASLPVLNQAGILQVSPSNTYAGLTRSDGGEPGEPDIYYPSGERTYVRVVPAEPVEAGALVGEMAAGGCSTVFIVAVDETYGRGLADAVERTADDAGVEVVGRSGPGPTVLDELESTDPDCLMFAGITADGAAELANEAGRALPELRMFFPDGCAETYFTEDLDRSVQDRVFVTNPTLDYASYPAAGQQFVDTFRQEHGQDPEPYAIYGYEAMSLVLDAIDRAGEDAGADDAGRAAVVAAAFATTDRDSVLGSYSIDDYGDTTLAAYGVLRVEDGVVRYDHAVEPAVVPPSTGPEITDPPEPPVEPSVEPSAPPETANVSPIEGTWRGGKVTEDMVATEWGRKAARFVFEAIGAGDSVVTTLELRGDSWQVLMSADGGPNEPAQGGTYSVVGDRIFFEEPGLASYVYRFDLEGDVLHIELVESDAEPAAPGVPDDVFQFVQHEATPYHKVG